MAYDGTIPSLSNQIGNDIPQMQENFSLLEDSQVVDEGSTEDGDYIRYENGWQICIRNFAASEIDWSVTDDNRYDMPANFLDREKIYYNINVRLSGGDPDTIFSAWSTCTLEALEAEWRLLVIENQTTDTSEVTRESSSFITIGRWK